MKNNTIFGKNSLINLIAFLIFIVSFFYVLITLFNIYIIHDGGNGIGNLIPRGVFKKIYLPIFIVFFITRTIYKISQNENKKNTK